MWMQQRVSLKLSQKPVLTQSLRQLVKLLVLNKLELKKEITQELTENPILEISSEADGEADQNREDLFKAEEHTNNPTDWNVLKAAGNIMNSHQNQSCLAMPRLQSINGHAMPCQRPTVTLKFI